GVNFFLAIKQKTPNRWVSNFRGSLHKGGFFIPVVYLPACGWPTGPLPPGAPGGCCPPGGAGGAL
ncbi:hypothetical protein, partial [Erwinia mallotivora]